MPRIFDNIELRLNEALLQTLANATRADFCVGYFNLRGWREIDSHIQNWEGGDNSCRLMIGMHRSERDEVRRLYRSKRDDDTVIDNATALRCKEELAREFRQQLTIGAPTKADEEGLLRLTEQLRKKQLQVKLFLRYPLHAKLYLAHTPSDYNNPLTGFIGSSNLTFAGLAQQGELNVDVLDHDAAQKLSRWFDERWDDRRCVDISKELLQVLEESWITPRTPYEIYLKMAYHLSHEARAGLSEFRVPKQFSHLFEFQKSAVKIAAHHLNRRGGVVIGDVVGLGKTLMATALARLMEDDFGLETLIICPPNLEKMWDWHIDHYGLRAKTLSSGSVVNSLPEMPRRRLVLIDESHNLRSRDGMRYAAIKEYIERNDSKVILLSATPYNKSFWDLSSQLRLFIPENQELPVRPEQLLREVGDGEFARLHQCAPRSLSAFEKSPYPDDWRELMRLYMVRRTRSFIRDNYAKLDTARNRKYLEFPDATRSYFPDRLPKTITFANAPDDQFSRLYAPEIVDAIDGLLLPRYGLGGYLIEEEVGKKSSIKAHVPVLSGEAEITQCNDLGRAGERLKGFCRTNLFKRLESSGASFILSLQRHVLRNYIFLHALENELPLPIGTQDASFFEAGDQDESSSEDDDDEISIQVEGIEPPSALRKRASIIYESYSTKPHRFQWLRAALFDKSLKTHLKRDAKRLEDILKSSGAWDAAQDSKLEKLFALIQERHGSDKVLVFSQFADTVKYLQRELTKRGITQLATATGDSADATEIAWRFSPISNGRAGKEQEEIRVLVATDVLSEGQNLQDGHIIVNYDLPWAIIRLIQRAGRVDRIGQQSDTILCYSFLPAEGVEKILDLRGRLKQRLRQNAEVLGSDEGFFDDDEAEVVDLYNEKFSVLEGDEGEVDLASYAWQIWKNATDAEPALAARIEAMPDVVSSAKSLRDVRPDATSAAQPRRGALVYTKTANNSDHLAWLDVEGNTVTESQYAVLRAAECASNTELQPLLANQYELVEKALETALKTEQLEGATLGGTRSVRRRVYERLKSHIERARGTLFYNQEWPRLLDELLQYPLLDSARESLARQMRAGLSDEQLCELLLALREENRLFLIADEDTENTAQVLCSMGIA